MRAYFKIALFDFLVLFEMPSKHTKSWRFMEKTPGFNKWSWVPIIEENLKNGHGKLIL